MQRKLLALTAVVAIMAVAGVAQAQEASSWIHIRVDEADGAKVNVNLPMSLIEVALDIAEEQAFDGHHGEMHFGRHGDMDVEDLRRMWNELRASGDAEYINVEDHDEHVRIYRRGDRVHIQVDEDGDEKVRMEVPFSVVDVLLEGEGERLNFAGAIREMAGTNDGEILQVNDGDTTVRIWIDNKTEG